MTPPMPMPMLTTAHAVPSAAARTAPGVGAARGARSCPGFGRTPGREAAVPGWGPGRAGPRTGLRVGRW